MLSSEIKQIDPGNSRDLLAMIEVLQSYAQDIMGGGQAIPESTIENLKQELPQQSNYVLFMAYLDQKPVGIANCFVSFSTFKAKLLINIHDLAVLPDYRGHGIGSDLLRAISHYAKKNKMCKVTLEVRSDNQAKDLYRRHGFGPADYAVNDMLFWEKVL